MKYWNSIVLFVAITVVFSITGCFKAKKGNLQAFQYPDEVIVTADQYSILPPDSITVICSTVPELAGSSTSQGQTQTVRPDGVISFERVGEIMVAGKTPKQVADLIAEKLVNMYKFTGDNPVEVRVQNQSHYYYMTGMIQYPGAKLFTGRETTLSAIAKAVPTTLAWKDMVQVIRPSFDPKVPSKVFALDYRKMVEQGDMKCNVMLQEGDVIYVPPTILASIGLTVQEIVGPILQGGSAYRAIAGM